MRKRKSLNVGDLSDQELRNAVDRIRDGNEAYRQLARLLSEFRNIMPAAPKRSRRRPGVRL